ncbi:MAG: FAD-dependent oxidoreductase, partial [Myxococcota bacterium]
MMSISQFEPASGSRTTPSSEPCEVIVVGGGIAGLMTALRLAPVPVTLVLKSSLSAGASTLWAQAGFAAAMGVDDDVASHAEDTLFAGAGICDVEAVRLMTKQAPDRIKELVRLGVPFDRREDGLLSLRREAAHGRARVVGVQGDRTGRAFMETIVPIVRETKSIRVIEGGVVQSLVASDHRVSGVLVRPVAKMSDLSGPTILRAKAVVLATGGVGGLYEVTTNPPEATGDGLAMAARAGAELADLEFVQFHPTAMDVGVSPAPLATEAIRGDGAILVTDAGERFMPAVDPQAELAPRDVVARAVAWQIRQGRQVFLDGRDAIGERFGEAFPTVDEFCRSVGIDPSRDRIPVAPAAHYHMGGIATDEC